MQMMMIRRYLVRLISNTPWLLVTWLPHQVDTGGGFPTGEVVVSLSAQMMLTNKVIHLGISSVLFVLDMCVVVM